MTAETWTAKAKLASFHVLQFKVDEDGFCTPRDDEPGPPVPALPGPYPWRDEEERKLRIAALELKRMVLQDLRDGLEGREPRRARRKQDPLAPLVPLKEPPLPTWDNPFVYVQIEYPLSDNKALVPPAELEDEAQALWWIGSRLNKEWGGKTRVITTLQTLTRLAAFVRRNGKTYPIVPLPFFDRYQAMTEPEKERFLLQWFSPVSHGDSYSKDDDAGRAVPDLDASIEVHGNGKTFRAAVIFEVYPLFLDLEAGRAFYTLKAGLPWAGDMGSPATWTEAERNALWEALFSSLDKLAAYYKLEEETLPDKVEVFLAGAHETKPATWDEATWDEATWASELVTPDEAEDAIASTMTIVSGGSKTFPVAFGTALADADAVAFVQQSHHLRLPRSWAKIRKWEDLKQEHINEILETQSADAFQDFRSKTRDPTKWPKLRKVFLPGKTTPVSDLSPEEERELRRQHGTSRGFLDRDPRGRQALYRCVPDSKGNLLEVWLSWSDMAWPLFRDRLDQAKKELLAQLPKENPKEPELFEDLDDDLKRKLNRDLERLNLYDHGRSLMEALLGIFGKYRTNPVEVPAEAARRLLWPAGDWPQDWKQIVERTLGALRGMTIFYTAGKALKGEHGFLSGWDYVAKGQGGHGEGVYIAWVDPVFFGSLKVFEIADGSQGGVRLRSGADAVVYDFSKDIPPDDRNALNFVSFDAGRTFYHAAAGLKAEQRNLVNWLEGQITEKRDPIPKGRKREQSKPKAKGEPVKEPRLYDKSFCPLLPEERSFVAALGHFRRNPEAGFTLYGTASKASKASGGHIDGLVAVLGYPLAPGRAHDARRGVVRQALQDLKAVAVDYLGGVVVGKLGGRGRGQDDWLPLDKWTDLDEETLCRKLKVFVFLPPDWNQRRRDRFEKVTGYRVTENIAEAQAAAWGTAAPQAIEATAEPQAKPAPGIYRGEADGWKQLGPLPNRLYAALEARKLKRTDLARIFGVTPGAVTRWLYGMKLGEDQAKAKPIPADLGSLMVRWLESGQEPTPDELAALPSRSRTPRGGGRKAGSEAA